MKNRNKIVMYFDVLACVLALVYIVYEIFTKNDSPFPYAMIVMWVLLTIQCFETGRLKTNAFVKNI
ncbi:hypothetical protein CHRY9390_01971 [Chryseobacterium aquaeductus]|uniref:Uncharacterized protein n=1 Tax=Chryseobacterium aquaeductus TaxID=2675056 RepID=A0A9N8MP26_9FLAO|nr:hypothetical protein [Chryseobacterium aquaeductus]CAA7331283.1 hypothetical protein CHRY9390_01971 [Chryseobacterium potabilaquae]CAD7809277.1 hypothetical protein CHRY9390_01971 [Chryseobacterium aquaeductus]